MYSGSIQARRINDLTWEAMGEAGRELSGRKDHLDARSGILARKFLHTTKMELVKDPIMH